MPCFSGLFCFVLFVYLVFFISFICLFVFFLFVYWFFYLFNFNEAVQWPQICLVGSMGILIYEARVLVITFGLETNLQAIILNIGNLILISKARILALKTTSFLDMDRISMGVWEVRSPDSGVRTWYTKGKIWTPKPGRTYGGPSYTLFLQDFFTFRAATTKKKKKRKKRKKRKKKEEQLY